MPWNKARTFMHILVHIHAALDLDTYPLSKLIRPQCAEWAKPGRGKPVLINPRRECAARVSVLSLCVCSFVYLRLFSHYRLQRWRLPVVREWS